MAASNLQLGRPRLPQLLHRQPQEVVLYLRLQNSADDISLRRPHMQNAFIVLARNRILRLRQIEQHRAILNDRRIGRAAKKLL